MAKNLTPAVSVVMSVHNGAPYLRMAIDSILKQSLRDFEFIIIDDGSTDETAAILRSYRDKHLRVITEPKNKGLVAGLNTGIAAAMGRYIARQDADDASLPERLQKQYDYLQSHPDTVIVGSSMQVMDATNQVRHTHAVLLHDPELRAELLVRSPFAHGSIMMRTEACQSVGDYRQSDWPAEDYGLWVRLAAKGTLANLDQALYIYREYDTSISAVHNQAQQQQTERIRGMAWRSRRALLADRIATAAYVPLDMGHFRIERIARNLLFVMSRALRRGQLPTAARALRLLLVDRYLRRKIARFMLLK